MSDRSRRVVALLVASAAGTIASRPALAHGAFGSAAPFWSGALHVGVSPLAIAAIVGLAAALARALTDPVFNAVSLAALIAGLAAWLLPPAFGSFGSFAVVIVGLVAVLGRAPTDRMCLLLGACAGFGIGASVDLDIRGWAQGLGVAAASLLAIIWAVEILSVIRTRLPLAGRVVGAWVAAIALLLAALTLRLSTLVVRSAP